MSGTNLSPQLLPVFARPKRSLTMDRVSFCAVLEHDQEGVQKKVLWFSCDDSKQTSRSGVFFNLFVGSITLGNPLIATNKLSLATWGSYYHQDHLGPGTYAFGYDIEDPVTGNIQFKQEERHPNGTVTGNYGYVDADGRPYVVTYVSDENGYRAKIEIEGEPAKHYPPDTFSFSESSYKSKETLKVQKTSSLADTYGGNEGDQAVKKSPLIVPLQGEILDPQIPIVYRLNYPSYYKYVGVNAASE